jgi:hypothetical protein
MASTAFTYPEMNAVVDAAVKEMMRVQHWGETSFVSFPIFYPSGAPVTVRIVPAVGGYRIDDNGFAYRELESVGFERSFPAAAGRAKQECAIEQNRRCLYVEVPSDQLERAMSDIAIASWNVADRVFGKLADHDERDIEEYLRERLARVFGAIEQQQTITGSSRNPWDVSAIVKLNGDLVVFQAVGDHPNSIYRTSAAFHDLAALPSPPKLVSVVKSKEMMGHKVSILSQAGRVIETDQSDEVYLRAAA